MKIHKYKENLLENLYLDKDDITIRRKVDGYKLNNVRSNLRIVDSWTNNCNRCIRSDNTSGITGICWSNYHQHYQVQKIVHGIKKACSSKTLEGVKIKLAELCAMDSTYTKRHGK